MKNQKVKFISFKGVMKTHVSKTKERFILIKTVMWGPRNDKPEMVHGTSFTLHMN